MSAPPLQDQLVEHFLTRVEVLLDPVQQEDVLVTAMQGVLALANAETVYLVNADDAKAPNFASSISNGRWIGQDSGPPQVLDSAVVNEVVRVRRPVALSDTEKQLLLLPLVEDLSSPVRLVLAATRSQSPFSEQEQLLLGLYARIAGKSARTRDLIVSLRASLRDKEREAQAASSSNRAKTLHLSQVSHELKTPLNALLGYAQMIRADLSNSPLRESADRVISAAEHLVELINQLQGYLRVDHEKWSAAPVAVNAADALRESVDLIAPLALERGVDLTQDSPAKPFVLADPVRLRQILINLLFNAVKFTGQGGSVQVVVAQLDSETVQISITDNGSGIPRDAFDTLATPPLFLDLAQAAESGSGIGLPLSVQLVQEMGGEIAVDSTVGEGTTFHLYFPSAKPTESLPSRNERAQVLADHKTIKVLHLRPSTHRNGQRRIKIRDGSILYLSHAPKVQVALTHLESSSWDLLVIDDPGSGVAVDEIMRTSFSSRTKLVVTPGTPIPPGKLEQHAPLVANIPATLDGWSKLLRDTKVLQTPSISASPDAPDNR